MHSISLHSRPVDNTQQERHNTVKTLTASGWVVLINTALYVRCDSEQERAEEQSRNDDGKGKTAEYSRSFRE